MLQNVNHRCSLHVSPQGSLQQWEPAVERRVSDLKLDSDKSTGRDGDSRPSSGRSSFCLVEMRTLQRAGQELMVGIGEEMYRQYDDDEALIHKGSSQSTK